MRTGRRQKMQTLDEAILYCGEKAKICRELAILYKDDGLLRTTYYKNEGEYLQFQAYLKELKRLRGSERPKGEWMIQTYSTFPQYQPNEFVCPFCKNVVNRMTKFCSECGADMRGLNKNENSVE